MSKYLERAFSERIVLKNKHGYIELSASERIYENPSPSGDPFYDDPRNVEELERRIDRIKNGEAKFIKMSDIDMKKLFAI